MDWVVLTIFPEMFDPFWAHGIIRRAVAKKKIQTVALNIRDYASDRHQMTDDRPYGGGSGMVMKPEPLAAAILAARKIAPAAQTVLLTPQGRIFDQGVARELSSTKGLILVCGRYEGVDERICHDLIDDEISIGDYVLTGGELAAMIIIDAVTRLLPGALGGEDSAEKDSFVNDRLEHAQYTRPQDFGGKKVPEVLLSGHHRQIEAWRLESSLMRTLLKRPDLLSQSRLGQHEIEILEKWHREIEKLLNINRKER